MTTTRISSRRSEASYTSITCAANLREATRLIDEVIDLARRIGDPAMLVEAYHSAGAQTFHLGTFQTARDWLQQSLEAGDYRGRFHSEVYGINMGVFCRAYIGHCDWHLGYPDRALKTAEEALSLAREVAHPFSIALALDYLAMLHQFRREPEAALRIAEEARSLCLEYRFDYYARGARLCGPGPSQRASSPKRGSRPTMRP